ncbi:NADPH:quinone oxidoreductase family protein [Roseococcus sp. DSY-14]|uniref:NADPH:quinone oxidoreductase family protein n=1 Tax=Roseococcus sp. DSY-14 TaxID=3369650 RepID=UPI00387AA3B0
MRAALVQAFGGPDAAAFTTGAPEPQPREGEALVALEAAEVNFPDLLAISGRYQLKAPLPFVPGVLAVGRVVSGGPYAPGTRVAASVDWGAFAERAAVPANGLAPLDEDIPAPEAAALGLAAQTAWFALAERARLQPGESLLVLGASGAVGLAAIGIARALGAGRVVAAVRGEAHAALAQAAGAHHVLRLDGLELRDGLRAALAGCGGPVDAVLDPVGGEATEAALRCLDWCGRLVVVGFAAGGIPAIKANYLLLKNIAVLGLQWTDYRARQPDKVRAAWRDIAGWWRAGLLRPVIGATLPLERAAEALAMVAQGAGGRRVVLDLTRRP